MEETKRLGKEYEHLVKKRAIVGVTGIKRVIASTVAKFTNSNFYYFSSVEEAKDFLSKE